MMLNQPALEKPEASATGNGITLNGTGGSDPIVQILDDPGTRAKPPLVDARREATPAAN
jgi:hypothetical protein